MQMINRKSLSRLCAMVLALMLIFSSTASFAAAAFTKSGAGVKYNGTFKLGAKTTEAKLKKAFGKKYTHNIDDGCTFGYATHEYIFKSKGIRVETLEREKGGKQEIITIEISKSSVPTIGKLKVGYKTSKLAKLYGTDCEQDGTTVRYHDGNYFMYVYTKKKKITKIAFVLDLEA